MSEVNLSKRNCFANGNGQLPRVCKKQHKMKKVLFVIITLLGINVTAFAQSLKEMTNYSMSIFLAGKTTIALTQSVEIDTGKNKVAVYTAMINPLTKKNDVADTSIIDASTLAPIYHASVNSDHNYELHFGNNAITGYYIDKRTQKNTAIKDPVNLPLIDGSSLDYMFTKLPLSAGFKKNFNVYNYNPNGQSSISKASIGDVENDTYASIHYGNRNVWKVSMTAITPNGEQRKYIYYLDKDTRRLWHYDVEIGGKMIFSAVNNEDDYNPYHSTFDKKETLKLITEGKSVISGQAFARENDAAIKGIAIINLNKKQVAQMGTAVILIPYTDFFKEWYEQNKKASKTGKSAPLPMSAIQCIKTTKISDNEGHFEFTNLMPGDYLLITQFTMKHGASQTEVTGYTDTYINGTYQGTNTNTTTHYFNVLMTASAQKVVTIKQDGETAVVKLKQTQQ